ncbi:tetratricopeptide repeat protein [Hydrogenophaga sp.]|uniref:O-linked N-acetylglucosamine transferase, SPINDLY family protein n=1 Tax=Hydrogenophaga sp. TaxID=1904254 RepID=UPI0035B3AD77
MTDRPAPTPPLSGQIRLVPPRRSPPALARALFEQQRWPEAEAAYDSLRRQHPDDPDIAHRHALTLLRQQRSQEASQALRETLDRWPDFLPARLNLAAVLRHALRRPAEALAVLTPALTTHAGNPTLHFNMGRARQDLLDTEGALDSYRQAITLDPHHVRAFSAYAFCSHYLPHPDLDALRDWVTAHARSMVRPGPPLPPRRASPPGPRLRIGLLSGDLSDHPVAYFLESALAALQRRGVELFAYATGDRSDAVSARLQRLVTRWLPASVMSEVELAQAMAADRLDVLLDLAGFTNHQRLGTLMMRPAPLQLSWLGYFGTLGLSEIDGVIADPDSVPPQEQRFFSERVFYLPRTRLCMSPPADAPLPSPEPPLARAGGLRFACLQNVNKINPRVLGAWQRILDAAPQSTLLIRNRQLSQPDVRAAFEARLDACGIDRSRVELGRPQPRATHLARHDDFDVLLDTFPYPGGTTTAEALWMGVPTLTLATPGLLGRQGQSLLHQVGLDDWVTHSDDAYVERAVALANDREGTLATLRHLRGTLRETARTSPLFDAEAFARDFEALLRRACTEAAGARGGPPPAGAS